MENNICPYCGEYMSYDGCTCSGPHHGQQNEHEKGLAEKDAEILDLKQEILELKQKITKLEKHLGYLSAAQHLNATKIFEAGPLQAALARIKELEAELSDWQRYCAIVMREYKEQKGA